MKYTRFGNPANAGSRIRNSDYEQSYVVHSSDFLAHYGVKGQKWGVITKEYQPVAVDHRRNFSVNPIKNVRAHYQKKDARQSEIDRHMREERQRIFEKRNAMLKQAGTILGVGALAFSLYGGYKLSKIHVDGKQTLKSLLNVVPKKNERSKIVNDGLTALVAKLQTSTSGFAKVKQTLKDSAGIMTGQKYRRRIKMVRNLIEKFKSTPFDQNRMNL